MTTPREAGFFMPAEWAPHAGCWMAWPCRPENWDDIERARAVYARVAREIAAFEPVTMTANAEDAGAGAARARRLRPTSDVVAVPSDDSWARDTAPTFVVDGRGGLAGVDWRFNAYGGIYEDYARTRNMARRILDLLGARRFAAPLVLEGGAVHIDGDGTLLTTTEVVLDPRRNPGLEKGTAERILCDHLGAERVIWLTSALDHDNTGGHVDNLAASRPRESSRRSAAPIATTRSTPPCTRTWRGCARPQTPAAASWRWSSCRRRRGPEYRGRRLSPCYVNFYVADGAVLMPGFDDPADDVARDILARLYPGRAVIQLPTLELAKADGNIHCVTQQQPVV